MHPHLLKLFCEQDMQFRVCGSSMEPVLSSGALVTVEHRKPRIGDIVLFCRNGELFLHRLYACFGQFCATMGDNTPVPDRPLKSESIVGVLPARHRSLRLAVKSLVRALKFAAVSGVKKLSARV
jgi:hypothetical protein